MQINFLLSSSHIINSQSAYQFFFLAAARCDLVGEEKEKAFRFLSPFLLRRILSFFLLPSS
jgi:hypothetical protein